MIPSDIYRLRKRLGLTADGFANLLGLDGTHRAQNVLRWEKGLTTPTKERLKTLELLRRQTSEKQHDDDSKN